MSDLLTVEDVAKRLGYANRSGALKWLVKNDVRMYRRGRIWLVRESNLDAALEKNAVGDRVARVRGRS